MSGFQNYHQRAIKPEWTEHYVGYDTLKSKLSSFSKRRVAFKKIRACGGHISEEDLYLVTVALELDTSLLTSKDVLKKGKHVKENNTDAGLESKYYPYK